MSTFTVTQAQAATEQFVAEHQAMFESLLKLNEHLDNRLPDSAALAGVTRRRRAEMQYFIETLWALYQPYRARVMRSQAMWSRRSQLTPADLTEIEELITGATTVTLPSPDGSSEPLHRHLTRDELLVEFRTAYAEICTVVDTVDRVRAELNPRLEHCHELLSQAEAFAATHGFAADSDPVASTLLHLADRLDAVRQIALTDPLRLWAEQTVDLTEIEQLTRQCEQAHAELLALDEVRRSAEHRLDLVEATFTEAARLHRETFEERYQAHIKIHGIPAPERGDPREDPPESRLVTIRELSRRGGWRRLATELAELERDAEAALQHAKAELADSGRPLRERAELRGRLGAYRAKAAALGRVEDLALEELHQRARTLLWSAPCDLARAAATVTEYQSAVNAAANGKTR